MKPTTWIILQVFPVVPVRSRLRQPDPRKVWNMSQGEIVGRHKPAVNDNPMPGDAVCVHA